MDKPVHEDERAAALAALSADQQKRLTAYAEILARGTEYEGSDLLQEAFARWMASNKSIEDTDQTCIFLSGAIKSVRSNWKRHERIVRETHGVRQTAADDSDDDPVHHARDLTTDAGSKILFEQLFGFCAGDEDVQMLLLARLDNSTADEIRNELGWNQTHYETVRTRKNRLVKKWMREGKL